MPSDITFCSGGICTLKEHCLRFTGSAYGRIVSFGQPPYDFQSGKCEHFWDDRPDENQIRIRAFQIYEQNGRQQGKEWEDWIEAQRILIEEKRNR